VKKAATVRLYQRTIVCIRGRRHGTITLRIGAALLNPLASEQAKNGWSFPRGRLVTTDPGLTLARRPDTVRAPDIASVSRERHGYRHHRICGV